MKVLTGKKYALLPGDHMWITRGKVLVGGKVQWWERQSMQMEWTDPKPASTAQA